MNFTVDSIASRQLEFRIFIGTIADLNAFFAEPPGRLLVGNIVLTPLLSAESVPEPNEQTRYHCLYLVKR